MREEKFKGPLRAAISLVKRRRNTCNLFNDPVLRFLNFQGRIQNAQNNPDCGLRNRVFDLNSDYLGRQASKA
jgi:hypothetical protein